MKVKFDEFSEAVQALALPRCISFPFGGAQLKVKFGKFSEALLVFAVPRCIRFPVFNGAQLKVGLKSSQKQFWSSLFHQRYWSDGQVRDFPASQS